VDGVDFTTTIRELQSRIFNSKTQDERMSLLNELNGILDSHNFSTRNGWGYMIQLQMLKRFLGDVGKQSNPEVINEKKSSDVVVSDDHF
jgi:hypothetical protein